MSQLWLPAPIDLAVKGKLYLNKRILAVSKKEFYIHKDQPCRQMPTLILTRGSYKMVLINS